MSFYRPQFLLAISSIFFIKEVAFSLHNYPFESLLVLQLFGLPICIEILTTIIVPPSLEVLGNIDFLGVFMPYSIDVIGKWLNDFFKGSNVLNRVYFKTLDKIYQLINEMIFLFIVLDKRTFHCLYTFFDYQNVDSDGSIIWCKSLVWVDVMIFVFWWVRM